MPITRKLLASGDWTTAFEESGFKVMTLRGLNDFAIIHDWKTHQPKTKVRIYYSAFGTRFASPSEAIKYYNAEETRRRVAALPRRPRAPGAAQPAAGRKGALPRRRDVRAGLED